METIQSLGEVIPPGAVVERDAIHIAVMPVVTASEYMNAGEHVKFSYGSNTHVVSARNADDAIGVIDPFLKNWIAKGDRVWLYLYPNTITGLRHNWTHPGVDNPPIACNEHEKWLRDYADEKKINFESMIEAIVTAAMNTGDGDVYITSGFDSDGPPAQEFWDHVEGFNKIRLGREQKDKIVWSCSC